MIKRLVFAVFIILYSTAFSQQKEIFGKITDANNGEALPYVPVYVVLPNQQKIEATTDFDGVYKISYSGKLDSLVVKMDGYKKQSKYLNENFPLENNFQLSSLAKKERVKNIQGVNITVKKKVYKNPAWEILEKLVDKKKINNPEKLSSYSYENYSRMEVAIDNLSENFKNKKIGKELNEVMQSAKEVAGENGQPILPIFVSENLSDYYYQKNPDKVSEIIKKSHVEGVGIENGSMFSQLISSTFVRYNFYNNYIRILSKDFVSPINDNFKLLYDYELVEKNFKIGNEVYYKINYKPKRESDLAFSGTIWVAHGSYALYRVDATVSPSANINFIHSLKIQQEMTEIPEESAWLPGKTRVFVETSRPGKESVGVLLRYYASNKDIKVNQKIDEKYFKEKMTVTKDATENDEEFWNKNRHEPLTAAQKKMYGMISEVKNLPTVRTYIDIIDLLMNGYYKTKYIDLGPFLYTLGYNDHEGLRLRAGFRTNQNFSDKLILGGYLSYGFKDQQFKFGANADYIFSREPWTQAGISYSHDLGQVAFMYEDFTVKKNLMFDSFTKNGKMILRRPFWQNNYQAYFQTDITKDITQKITFKHYNFDPLYNFRYRTPEEIFKEYRTSEIILETQWQPGRRSISTRNNKRIKVKENVYNPSVTFRYTHGFKGIFNSDFDYNKFALNIQQVVPMGIFGRGEYSLTGGIIPSKVPSVLLENHLGNSFIFYNKYAFNNMQFFEFTSDRFVSLQYTQNLEGLITNSLPLIKKWNWRNHFIFNFLVGDQGTYAGSQKSSHNLHGKPYMEFGYGFSNIFRFLRVDFVHRLTHLDHATNSNANKPEKFSVKLSVQIKL